MRNGKRARSPATFRCVSAILASWGSIARRSICRTISKPGAVALGVEQIHALSPDPPQWFSKNRANILLTHHPPEWLTKGTQKTFAAEIAPAGRFALHLYGHLHELERGGRALAAAPSPGAFKAPHCSA